MLLRSKEEINKLKKYIDDLQQREAIDNSRENCNKIAEEIMVICLQYMNNKSDEYICLTNFFFPFVMLYMNFILMIRI